MESKNVLDQISFLTLENFVFGNSLFLPKDVPEIFKKSNDINKIMNYNNQNKGIITNSFFTWALENNISYEVINWFIKDFSCQMNKELEWLIDAFFNQYTIYLDESSNCVKFRFKDIDGNTNVNWYNDFVLSGIAFEGKSDPFNIDKLFNDFAIQKNIVDVKLKHIAKYNGEDNNRFINILKSNKVSVLLETLLNSNRVYIHWSTQNLLYFSLVDIVDSVLKIPVMYDYVKNILYNYVLQDASFFLSLLAKYDYPNIKENKISEFCEDFICWIDSLNSQSPEEVFALELLRQGIKTSLKTNDLIFLQDNTDRLLIENFVPIYAMRIAAFPNSIIHFDKCGIVEENIENYINIYCANKVPSYDFIDSKNNKWIQLSDMICGINGALMAYINTNSILDISKDLKCFNETQNKNLLQLLKLRKKSCMKNKYFDNISKNYQQIERIKFLMNYYNI